MNIDIGEIITWFGLYGRFTVEEVFYILDKFS